MEINITHLTNGETPWRDYSASAMELGQDAGKITWGHAMEDAPGFALFPESDCDELREQFQRFGAWTEEELKEMDYTQLQALLLQFLSGDIREVPSKNEPFSPEWWKEYEGLAEDGLFSCMLGKGEDGTVWWYFGG